MRENGIEKKIIVWYYVMLLFGLGFEMRGLMKRMRMTMRNHGGGSGGLDW